MNPRYLRSALMGIAALAYASAAHAALLGTAFTYQGQLKVSSVPANVPHDMRFTLTDDTGVTVPGTVPICKDNVPFTNGLFAVELDFGAQFPGDARELKIEVRSAGGVGDCAIGGGFTTLPRQKLTLTPYAARSLAPWITSGTDISYSAGNVGIGTPSSQYQLDVKASNGIRLGLQGSGGGQLVLGNNTNDNKIYLEAFNSTGDGSAAELLLTGYLNQPVPQLSLRADTTYASGNVGIGTDNPDARLRVSGGDIKLDHSTSIRSSGRLHIQTDVFDDNLYLNPFHGTTYVGYGGGPGNLNVAGNVGIGTNNPLSALHLSNIGNWNWDGGWGDFTLSNGTVGLSIGVATAGGGTGDVRIWPTGGTERLLFGNRTDDVIMTLDNGNVGIGTLFPAVKLDVLGDAQFGDGAGRVSLGSDGNAYIELREMDGSGVPFIDFSNDNASDFDARIILGDDNRLVVEGARLAVPVLEILGGSDLSESFDVNGGGAAPGSVVVIDPDQPGKLKLSAKAYDRTVAGVISGAGGVQSGLVMGQEGSVAYGKQNVALTGRVYCRCDASTGAIQPGDLLTTSATPGHAMKVTDHTAAQGAILGKAMTPLTEGNGLVLVLVSLQ